jgi:plastocyanin
MSGPTRRGAIASAAMAAAVLGGAPVAALAAPATHRVEIRNMRFGPVPANVHVGDTIIWVNRDVFRHTATARNRSFNVDLPPSASVRMVVRRSGVTPFYCIFHPGMTGQLVIAR